MRKWNKRLLSWCLLAALLLSMSGCQQGNTTSSAVSSQAVSSAAASSEETTEGPVETYHDMPVQTLDLDPSDPDYYQKALETELYNYKLIRNVPTAYQAESWDAYTATDSEPTSMSTRTFSDSRHYYHHREKSTTYVFHHFLPLYLLPVF